MQSDLTRRQALSLFGSAAVGMWAAPLAGALAAEGTRGGSGNDPAVFTPPGVKRDLPAEVYALPRAVFAQRGDFDLDDPAQLARARLKSIFSLDGSTSYVVRLSRALICPPGAPADTVLHEMLFWHSFVTRGGRAASTSCRSTTRTPTMRSIRWWMSGGLSATLMMRDPDG